MDRLVFEEPFAVASVVAVVWFQQHLSEGLAWHSIWWLFVAAFVEPVASKWCVYCEVVVAAAVAAVLLSPLKPMNDCLKARICHDYPKMRTMMICGPWLPFQYLQPTVWDLWYQHQLHCTFVPTRPMDCFSYPAVK